MVGFLTNNYDKIANSDIPAKSALFPFSVKNRNFCEILKPTAMRRLISVISVLFCFLTAASAPHTLPPLPYDYDALEPVMSRETLEYHHGKHVQAYVDKLNELIPGTPFENASLEQISRTADGAIFNNGAQILNHVIFFGGFAPESVAQKAPTGKLAEEIDRDFGSFDTFKKKFEEAAAGQFGSGWAWLVADVNGKLEITTTPNAVNPLRDGGVPLLGWDVWEHSYYIDYRNDRKKYLENLWQIVDWKVIEERYDQALR